MMLHCFLNQINILKAQLCMFFMLSTAHFNEPGKSVITSVD